MANVSGMPYFTFTQVPVYMQQQGGVFKGGVAQAGQGTAAGGFDPRLMTSNTASVGAVQQAPSPVPVALDPNWLAMQMRMMPPWSPQVGVAPMEAGYPTMAAQRTQ